MLKLSAFAVLAFLLFIAEAVPLGKNEGNQRSIAKLMPQPNPIPNNPAVHQPSNLDDTCDVQCPPGTHCFFRCGWSGSCTAGCVEDQEKKNNGNQESIAESILQLDPIPNNPAVHQPSNSDDTCDVQCPPGTHCFFRCGWSGSCTAGCVEDQEKKNNGNQGVGSKKSM